MAACALAALAGCVGLHAPSGEAPPGFSLAGIWVLDPAHSTDTRAALNGLERAGRRHSRTASGTDDGQGGFPGSGNGGGPGGGRQSSDLDMSLVHGPFVPDLSLQSTALAGGDWLKITQTPGEITIASDRGTTSYTPGEKSVVSVSTGVADQASGWKGKKYHIEIHPQVGPHITEEFRLSDDGKVLTEVIDIGRDGPIPSVKVTRTYHASRQIPSELPGG